MTMSLCVLWGDYAAQFKRRHSAMEKTYKEQLDANTRTIETLHSQVCMCVCVYVGVLWSACPSMSV